LEKIDLSISEGTKLFQEFAKSKIPMRLSVKYTKTRNHIWNDQQCITDIPK
jgi:hypothetical protein